MDNVIIGNYKIRDIDVNVDSNDINIIGKNFMKKNYTLIDNNFYTNNVASSYYPADENFMLTLEMNDDKNILVSASFSGDVRDTMTIPAKELIDDIMRELNEKNCSIMNVRVKALDDFMDTALKKCFKHKLESNRIYVNEKLNGKGIIYSSDLQHPVDFFDTIFFDRNYVHLINAAKNSILGNIKQCKALMVVEDAAIFLDDITNSVNHEENGLTIYKVNPNITIKHDIPKEFDSNMPVFAGDIEKYYGEVNSFLRKYDSRNSNNMFSDLIF